MNTHHLPPTPYASAIPDPVLHDPVGAAPAALTHLVAFEHQRGFVYVELRHEGAVLGVPAPLADQAADARGRLAIVSAATGLRKEKNAEKINNGGGRTCPPLSL